MTVGPESIGWLAVLGGLLALDGTSVGQFMVSRPLVAGTLAGWLLGDPAAGLAAGAVLELYLLVSIPTGGSRFPEGATATVTAVGTMAAFGHPSALPLAVALGLVWGQVGGASVTVLRRLNTRLVPQPGSSAGGGRVASIHALAVGLDLARGTLVTLAGLGVGRALSAVVGSAWPLDAPGSASVVLLGGLVSVGIVARDFGGTRDHRAWFVGGLLLSLFGVRLL